MAIKKFNGGGTERQTLQDLVLEIGNNASCTGATATAAAMVEESGNADQILVKLVNIIIPDAFEPGASDIHIEKMRDNLPTHIRFRKDGVMFDYSEVAPELKSALVSRLKIMCRLNISERRRPQDDKIDFSQFGDQRSSCGCLPWRLRTSSRTSSCVSWRLLSWTLSILMGRR